MTTLRDRWLYRYGLLRYADRVIAQTLKQQRMLDQKDLSRELPCDSHAVPWTGGGGISDARSSPERGEIRRVSYGWRV